MDYMMGFLSTICSVRGGLPWHCLSNSQSLYTQPPFWDFLPCCNDTASSFAADRQENAEAGLFVLSVSTDNRCCCFAGEDSLGWETGDDRWKPQLLFYTHRWSNMDTHTLIEYGHTQPHTQKHLFPGSALRALNWQMWVCQTGYSTISVILIDRDVLASVRVSVCTGAWLYSMCVCVRAMTAGGEQKAHTAYYMFDEGMTSIQKSLQRVRTFFERTLMSHISCPVLGKQEHTWRGKNGGVKKKKRKKEKLRGDSRAN